MAQADKALSARRVDDILRIRLDGAQWWDVLEYVREKELGRLGVVRAGRANPLVKRHDPQVSGEGG
jgi:hypothetical protein